MHSAAVRPRALFSCGARCALVDLRFLGPWQSAPRTRHRRFLVITTTERAASNDASQRASTTPRVTGPPRGDLTIRHSQHCEASGKRPFNGMGQAASVFSVPAAVAAAGREAPCTSGAYNAGSVSEEALENLSHKPFPPEVIATLHARLSPEDVAAKRTGKELPPVPFLPEIKYRRILNKAFGPGAWSLLPVGPVKVEGNVVSRDYQMFVFGRLVSEARGRQEFYAKGKTIEDAAEGVKSNALMRCCKDLGVASELWDPDWVRAWQSRQQGRAAPRF